MTDAASTAATEKDKPEEKGKGGKGDAKKGKDKGDKKVKANNFTINFHVISKFIIRLV